MWSNSEFVVELGLNDLPPCRSLESVKGIVDLQKRPDGTVFLYRGNSVELYTAEYGDVSEYVDVLEPPWDDYVRDTRNARATVEAEHDFSFADDANLLHLREYLKELRPLRRIRRIYIAATSPVHRLNTNRKETPNQCNLE